jgi:uncharacterized protein YbaR (Trm112 family)
MTDKNKTIATMVVACPVCKHTTKLEHLDRHMSCHKESKLLDGSCRLKVLHGLLQQERRNVNNAG